LAILAMLLQQTINGGYTVLTAAALTSDDPIKPETFALVRDGGASILLLIAARVTTKEGELFWPKREHIGDFALIGLCGVWAGQLLGAIAIKNIGAVVFSVMQPAQPVLTLFISVLVGIETLILFQGARTLIACSWAKIVGMVVTVTGAVLVLLLQEHKAKDKQICPALNLTRSCKDTLGVVVTPSDQVWYGVLVLVLEVVMGALYGIFQKGILGKYPPLVVTAWGYCFGLGEILMTLTPSLGQEGFFHVPVETWPVLAYSIVLNSALGYFIMAWVNNRTSPFFVTIFYPVQFVTSALFDFFFQSHKIDKIVFIGGAIITIGLYTVVYSQAKEKEFKTENGDGEGLVDPLQYRNLEAPVTLDGAKPNV